LWTAADIADIIRSIRSFHQAWYSVVASSLVSPKQVARAIGVSESSLKRWCDQGLIATARTAGGHRKLAIPDVLRFLREHDYQLTSPEVLGLPPASELAWLGIARGGPRLRDALLAGDEPLARQIVIDLYLARHPLSLIFDEVIAAAIRDLGDRWACHAADVYQERRGCEISLRVLLEVRQLLPPPKTAWRAMGATIPGDQYVLPGVMAELVLREAGFDAASLGNSIPFSSLVTAVKETRPHLFWLSVSHIAEGLDFVGEYAALSQACSAEGTALVVGGRALTEPLRQRIRYSSYCDSMQQLEAFALNLQKTLKRQAREAAPHSKARKSRS
jgi:methanogenic corrinoid protein MtbC1